ncbi:GIY-YIG nuclease family protein [Comamonas koreensis]|uniref:GIY-YIG nuclease family protein n=1 Tax=Comamonas koreensis TaxID=160825 RepID=UPI0015FDFC01|nr:GIY-YIG nuclease family protein [Comamonas koreensis]
MISTQLYGLLQERGIDPSAQSVTLMRHKTGQYPLQKYLGTRALTLYQAMQKRPHKQGGLIIGFYGHQPGRGVLLGLWRITDVMPGQEAFDRGLLKESLEPLEERTDGYYHELEELDLLDDLRMQLEITWTGRDIVWRRILEKDNDYPVRVRVEPAVPFTNASDVSLVMAELRLAMKEVTWQQGLGSIAGVYLITDEHSGRHYVGSAYGMSGIWQRWCAYAGTGHGGNAELIELLNSYPGRENEFRFTLLETLPTTMPRREVIARENYWKVALGSRRFGLNRN